jgi:hypothetical protein
MGCLSGILQDIERQRASQDRREKEMTEQTKTYRTKEEAIEVARRENEATAFDYLNLDNRLRAIAEVEDGFVQAHYSEIANKDIVGYVDGSQYRSIEEVRS